MLDCLRKNKAAFATIILVSFLWAALTYSSFIDDHFIPSPSALVSAWYKHLLSQTYYADIWSSTVRVFSAFALSLFMAIPTTILMYNSKQSRQVLSLFIDFVRYLPVPSLIPLTILFFGIGETSKITLLFIGTYFQLSLLILDDLDGIPEEYTDLQFTLNMNLLQRIGSSLNAISHLIYDNSRITLGWCWTYVVIAELVASDSGIGHMIKEAQRFSNTPDVFVGIFTMGLIGYSTDALLN